MHRVLSFGVCVIFYGGLTHILRETPYQTGNTFIHKRRGMHILKHDDDDYDRDLITIEATKTISLVAGISIYS